MPVLGEEELRSERLKDRAEVQRFAKVRLGQSQDTFDAIVDVRERTGLLTVSPHFNLTFSQGGFTAKRRRRLLSAASEFAGVSELHQPYRRWACSLTAAITVLGSSL